MNAGSRFHRLLMPLVASLILGAACVGYAQGASTEAEKEINEKLGKLRSYSDEERVGVTRDLALKIRALPAGATQFGMAMGLAFVSTEGDFGRDTLQEVTTTLLVAAQGHKAAKKEELDMAYLQLARLSRYEGMKVETDLEGYKAAVRKLDEMEATQARADFTLTDLEGKTWTRSALKGKVVLVNFWATWCPPCRKEMPDLEALYQEFKDQGFVVLAISDETLDKVKPFIDEHKYTYPVMLDPGRKVNDMYLVDGIPKNFLYDRDGKLVAQTIDMRTRKQFLEMLAKAGLKPKG